MVLILVALADYFSGGSDSWKSFLAWQGVPELENVEHGPAQSGSENPDQMTSMIADHLPVLLPQQDLVVHDLHLVWLLEETVETVAAFWRLVSTMC